MTTPPLAHVPVRTAAELTARWEGLLAPPSFAARSLWLTWLDDAVMLPVLIPIDDVPARPDRRFLANLAQICDSLGDSAAADRSHVALALCRPGRPAVGADDQAWAAGLGEAFAAATGTWSLHLAAGGRVQAVVDPPWPA